MKTRSKVVVILLLVAVVTGTAYLLLHQPIVGVQDIGDWGEASDERVEVVTTLWINNPNFVGVHLGDSVRMTYQLHLNGINLAEGSKEGVNLPPGNSSAILTTEIRSNKLDEWWVAYIQNNETIPVRAEPQATIETGPLAVSPNVPSQEKTVLADSTPVTTALSRTSSAAEGRYTRSITVGRFKNRFNIDWLGTRIEDRIAGLSPREQITVGYVIQRGWVTWGDVSEDTTVVHFHFRVHNPSEYVPVPAEPDNLGASIEMNGVEMFSVRGDQTALQNPREFSLNEVIDKRVIKPGETKHVVYAVRMDNNKISEWFLSHVRQGEQTNIRTEFQLVFSIRGGMFRIPDESPIAYTCELQTGILVDNQDSQTNCGSLNSISGVEAEQDSRSTASDDSSATGSDEPPTAIINTDQVSGTAPVEVTLDASASSDPDNDITQYQWRVKRVAPVEKPIPRKNGAGERITRTFRTAGTYEVTLIVTDSRGNQDREDVRIDVEPRV